MRPPDWVAFVIHAVGQSQKTPLLPVDGHASKKNNPPINNHLPNVASHFSPVQQM